MKFKEIFEKVSQDCSTGAGEIPSGPYKGWKAIRTNHLDDTRPPSERERDANFDCQTFDALIDGFLKKRPLGVQDGKYQITWKNKKGVQAFVINVDNSKKVITFITVMQLNKRSPQDYHAKGARAIDLGKILEPN